MSTPDLSPDCSRCDALCCVLLAFDASAAFALDKPACAPCPNLAHDNACTIHADLAAKGFKGCAVYTCHGAGQRITSQVFKGRSWRHDPALLPAIEDAFRSLRKLHEAAALLQAAASLPIPPQFEARRLDLLAALSLDQPWTEDSLRAMDQSPAVRDVRAFLASLRDLPAVRPPRP